MSFVLLKAVEFIVAMATISDAESDGINATSAAIEVALQWKVELR